MITKLAPQPFSGYPAPTSSTTYTPNQFFDVVLPNSSRGVVRIVGYMLRRILGWSDAEGNPKEPQVSFSYSELISKAGVSRSMVKDAIEEAIEKSFIRCIREPRPNLAGQTAVSGLYELCWDESEQYIKDINQFRGFYAGNGNLTYIPNKFFDFTVREESLSVVKVVGAIIRHTIGFQTKFGMRRQQVQVSLTRLQRITGIASREVLTQALSQAIENNHLIRIVDGAFKPGRSQESVTSVYAVRWADGESLRGPGRVVRAEKPANGDLSKFFAQIRTDRKTDSLSSQTQDIESMLPTRRNADRENEVGFLYSSGVDGSKSGPRKNLATVRNPVRENGKQRLEKRTEDGSKSGPETVRNPNQERLEKRTGIEITQEITLNNNNKAVAALDVVERLLESGFDFKTARALAERFPAEQILRQIELLPSRSPTKNPLGLLRKAIEEDWTPPAVGHAPSAGGRIGESNTSSRPERRLIGTAESDGPSEYQQFLIREARRIELDHPELYEQFLSHAVIQREKLLTSPFVTTETRDRVLESFDAPESRQKQFTEFLTQAGHLPPEKSYNQWKQKQGNS